MKHFGLGLIFGVSAGLVLSLFKDKNGDRLGKPLKENVAALKTDATALSHSIAKAKKASQELNASLPAAAKAIDGIATDVEDYQNHTANTISRMENTTQRIQNKFEDSKKDSKKD